MVSVYRLYHLVVLFEYKTQKVPGQSCNAIRGLGDRNQYLCKPAS